MRRLLFFLLLSCSTVLSAAELPPLGGQAKGWAASVGHGAVATAERRDGRWTFAIAGQPFAAGHAAVPAERVLFEIGSITKVFTGILLADAVRDGKLGLDDQAGGSQPAKRSEIALPAEALDEYAGVYSIDKTVRFTLLRRGDGLVARLTGQPFLPVFASAKDEFFYKAVDAQLSFHRDGSGQDRPFDPPPERP